MAIQSSRRTLQGQQDANPIVPGTHNNLPAVRTSILILNDDTASKFDFTIETAEVVTFQRARLVYIPAAKVTPRDFTGRRESNEGSPSECSASVYSSEEYVEQDWLPAYAQQILRASSVYSSSSTTSGAVRQLFPARIDDSDTDYDEDLDFTPVNASGANLAHVTGLLPGRELQYAQVHPNSVHRTTLEMIERWNSDMDCCLEAAADFPERRLQRMISKVFADEKTRQSNARKRYGQIGDDYDVPKPQDHIAQYSNFANYTLRDQVSKRTIDHDSMIGPNPASASVSGPLLFSLQDFGAAIEKAQELQCRADQTCIASNKPTRLNGNGNCKVGNEININIPRATIANKLKKPLSSRTTTKTN